MDKEEKSGLVAEYQERIVDLAKECADESVLRRVYTILILNKKRAGE